MEPLEHYFRIGRVRGHIPSYHWKETLKARRETALGVHMPFDGGRVAIGIAGRDGKPACERSLRSCRIALQALPEPGHRIFIAAEDTYDTPGEETHGTTVVLPGSVDGMFGLHDRFMRAAFDEGARYYVAVRDGALLEPWAIARLVAMAQASDDRAVIEAIRFPDESPRFYDPATFETSWASASCMLVPRTVFKQIGSFDTRFVAFCGDVDLSWRIREAGFSTRICPRALVSFADDEIEDSHWRAVRLGDGLTLSRKWASESFTQEIMREAVRFGVDLPMAPDTDDRRTSGDIADFSHGFAFSPLRFAC